jgi:hypothetical protein
MVFVASLRPRRGHKTIPARAYHAPPARRNGFTTFEPRCPTCGGLVFDKGTGMPGVTIVNAALLDDPTLFKPQMIIFTRSGLPWDSLDPQLQRFAEMPGA